MNGGSLLVRRPGVSISTLGSALMLLSSLYLSLIATFEALPVVPVLLLEFFIAVVLLSTNTLALFHPVSRLAQSLHTFVVLLNIPLVLLLGFILLFSRARVGGWASEDVVGPSIVLLVFGVLLTVIGGVISYLIAEIGDMRQMKQPPPLRSRRSSRYRPLERKRKNREGMRYGSGQE